MRQNRGRHPHHPNETHPADWLYPGHWSQVRMWAGCKDKTETLVFSFGPMYQPKVPPTPSKNPLEGLELTLGKTSAMNFLTGLGALSFFLNQSPIAPCWQSLSFDPVNESCTGLIALTVGSEDWAIRPHIGKKVIRTRRKIVAFFSWVGLLSFL